MASQNVLADFACKYFAVNDVFFLNDYFFACVAARAVCSYVMSNSLISRPKNRQKRRVINQTNTLATHVMLFSLSKQI